MGLPWEENPPCDSWCAGRLHTGIVGREQWLDGEDTTVSPSHSLDLICLRHVAHFAHGFVDPLVAVHLWFGIPSILAVTRGAEGVVQ